MNGRNFVPSLLVATIAGASACGQSPISPRPVSEPKSTVPSPPTPAIQHNPMRRGAVIFAGAERSPWRVEVEVAETAAQRAKGLMNRKSLGDEQGMLFIFEKREKHHFYMKNTYIPLDIIFLSHGAGEATVVGILQNMRPFDEVPRSIDAPSFSALEVRAPLASEKGVQIGDRVFLDIKGLPGAEGGRKP